MRNQKVTVKIIGNDKISSEELQRNWNMFLDIVLKKTISEKNPSMVGKKENDRDFDSMNH